MFPHGAGDRDELYGGFQKYDIVRLFHPRTPRFIQLLCQAMAQVFPIPFEAEQITSLAFTRHWRRRLPRLPPLHLRYFQTRARHPR